MTRQLTLGPVLYNWTPERWRDFYFQVADEMPVETVFLGEVICSKRAPLFDPHFEEVMTRLKRAGKNVVISTLAEVMSNIDRRLVERVATSDNCLVEVNDTSALSYLDGRPYLIGPYMNVYNEDSLDYFADKGAQSICLPPEMPREGILALGDRAWERSIELEVQVYGRMPLALSARCYHARAHDRTKDSCRFICELDPDGMDLHTLEGSPFLAINGIQTLSYTLLNLINELDDLAASGVSRFRISPQSEGTAEAAEAFHKVLNAQMSPEEAGTKLKESALDVPFSNGFFNRQPGFAWQL